jgi:hypothetical protein
MMSIEIAFLCRPFTSLKFFLSAFWLTLFALAATAAVGDELASDDRLPVPDKAAQERSAERLKEVLGGELEAAVTEKQRAELIGRLRELAADSGDDAEGEYVLLQKACDLSILNADGTAAIDAINQLANRFQVDALRLKASALFRAAKGVKADRRKALAGNFADVIDQALNAERFEIALPLCDVALENARKARDNALISAVTSAAARAKEMHARQAEIAKAKETLKASPEDPAANLALGKYLAFDRQRWDEGLPHLAKGADAAIAAAANADLANPEKPEAQVAAGDAWWDVGEKLPAAQRDVLRRRAGVWYEQAADHVTGLAKVKVTKRLDDLAALDAAAPETSEPEPTTPDPRPATRPARPPREKPKTVFPGMIGRVTVDRVDVGAVLQYLPGKRVTHAKIVQTIGLQGAASIELKLAGALVLSEPAALKVKHVGGSASGGVLRLSVNGRELGSVGDDRSKDSTYDLQLPAGTHLVSWELRGGEIGGGNLIQFTNAATMEAVPIVYTQQMLTQVRQLGVRLEADLSE